MLPPDDRAALLELLRPPTGYTIDHCVGTTYTLDLATALLPPLALTSLGLRNTDSVIEIISALRDTSTRIDIFCQAGQIIAPRQTSSLFAYLEPMIHQIPAPRGRFLFHPKVWVAKYRADDTYDDTRPRGSVHYRMLVLTRNLTGSANWDMALSLDGSPGTRPLASNRPVVDLLKYLGTHTVHSLAPSRAAQLTKLADEMRRVEWRAPDGLELVAFHALGLPGRTLPDFTGTRTLVISPFVTADGLATTARTGDVTVVSTVDTLDRLEPEGAARIGTPLVLSPDADLRGRPGDEPDGESAGLGTDPFDGDRGDATSTRHGVLSGLHAKAYVIHRNRKAYLVVGSANATGPAFGGNVEFLAEFVGSAKSFGIDTILDKNGLGPILLPYPQPFADTAPDPTEEAERRLAALLRSIAAVPVRAEAHLEANGRYTLRVTSSEPLLSRADYQMTARLHTAREQVLAVTQGRPLDAEFTELPLAAISALLIIEARSPEGLAGSCVLLADLVNEPAGRFDAVVASQLDTPEKFLHFLALLLGLGDPASLFDIAGGVNGTGSARSPFLSRGIFEQLIAGFAGQRQALHSARGIIEHMANDAHLAASLPADFLDVWRVVDKALRTLEETAP